MNILSLFNGISAMHLALDKAKVSYNTVYYAEIDKYANKVTEHHFPQDVPLGDVTKWREWDIDWSSIGLVGAGFPCQSWSVAGQQMGDKDERGMLFWTTLEIIAHVLKHNPSAKFVMENVKMKKDFEEYITKHMESALGVVQKTLLNSSSVSAQNRLRYYWTNFHIPKLGTSQTTISDIICEEASQDTSLFVNFDLGYRFISADSTGLKNGMFFVGAIKTPKSSPRIESLKCLSRNFKQGYRVYSISGKSPTLSTNTGGLSGGSPCLIKVGDIIRKMGTTECARLQTFPDGWSESVVSNTQAYKAYGNAWTVDVIAHILTFAFPK